LGGEGRRLEVLRLAPEERGKDAEGVRRSEGDVEMQ
jgi:hypothetical protein